MTKSTDATVFHPGEIAVQERVGVRDKIAVIGARNIRPFMPDQHRRFFEDLDFLFLGTVDRTGQPWATVVAGNPGFIAAPTRTRLTVAGRPETDDPATEGFEPGGRVGVLGLMPENRRRNRMNGRIAEAGPRHIAIEVEQSFGNCPQYIQTRTRTRADTAHRPSSEQRAALSEEDRARISAADTFFIASRATGDEDRSSGVDVSHRGGRPGFVKVDEDGVLVWPDFSGNLFFNTLGNISVDPRAGLLFADFETGDLLQLAGEAEVVWDGPEVDAFQGAERLVRFRPRQVVLRRGVLPIRFALNEPSPVLADTGTWADAARTLAANAERDTYRPFRIEAIVQESTSIRSFHLRPADGAGVVRHRPGQFLPIRLSVPGQDKPVLRTFTVSDAADGQSLRLTVKREPEGVASRHLHDTLRVGDTIEAMAPRGDFVLDDASDRPVVLISAGVGITPMIAMLNQIVADTLTGGRARPIWFLHGARNGAEQAFGPYLRTLARNLPNLRLHVRFSQPLDADRPGETFSDTGRVDVELLRKVLPFDDYDFYLCGPGGFVTDLHRDLRALNIAPERIRYEFFGPSAPVADAAEPAVEAEPTTVTFAASGETRDWSPVDGTLLDLAEAAGVPADWSCRSGRCGTCAVRVVSGTVGYAKDPDTPAPDGHALVCQAHPVGPVSLDL